MSSFQAGSITATMGLNTTAWSSGVRMVLNDAQRIRNNFTQIRQNAETVAVGFGAIALAAKGALGALVVTAAKVVESDNLFEVSMGNMAKSTRIWSEATAKALGRNAASVRESVGTFNVMIQSMGFTEQASSKMAMNLTRLTEDMSSFYNLSHEEAFQKLQSGLTGEIEPLSRIGILVNEDMVQQFAWRNSIAETGAQLTQQQKVVARYGLIMEATAKAQGDLVRTGDSPTNQFRRMQSSISSLAQELGAKLLPTANNYLHIANSIISRIRDWISANGDLVNSFISLAEKGTTYVAIFAGVTLAVAGTTRAFALLRSTAALAWGMMFGPAAMAAVGIGGLSLALYSLRAEYIDTFQAGGKALDSFKKKAEDEGWWSKTKNWAGWAGGLMSATMPFVEGGDIRPLQDAWNTPVNNGADQYVAGFGELKKSVQDLFAGTDGTGRPSFLDTIKKQFASDWDGLKGYIDKQYPGMIESVQKVLASFTNIPESLTKLSDPGYIQATMKELIDGINQGLAGAANTKNVINDIFPVDPAMKEIGVALDQVVEKFGDSDNALRAWAQWVVDTYGKKVPAAIDLTIEDFRKMAEMAAIDGNSVGMHAKLTADMLEQARLASQLEKELTSKNRIFDKFKVTDPAAMADDMRRQMNQAMKDGLNFDNEGAGLFTTQYWSDLSDSQRDSITNMIAEFKKLPEASEPAGKKVVKDLQQMFRADGLQKFGAGIADIGQKFSALGPKFSGVARIFSGLGNMVSLVGRGIEIFTKISEASAMTTRLAWESALGIFGVVLEAVYQLANAFGLLGDKGKKEAKGVDKVWKDFGSNLEGMLDELSKQIVKGEQDFAQFAKNAVEDLASIAVKELMLQPIVNFGKDILFNADGNAFNAGRVIPFAKGGVVTSETYFGMAGGRAGVMGEAGPEAIMPLERMPGGKLGVNANGGGGGQIVQIIDQRAAGAPPVQMVQETAANGQSIVRAIIRDVVHGDINAGRMDGLLGRNFGLLRRA